MSALTAAKYEESVELRRRQRVLEIVSELVESNRETY